MDNGAHFFRCDFQVHTPRDNNWAGTRPATEDEEKQFAEELVAACRRKRLGAIAVTDHHDFHYFPIIKAAAESESDDSGDPMPAERRLVVFPGIELTLGVPCQALLILDADFPEDRLSVVLEALAISAVDPAVKVLPPVQRLDHLLSLEQVHEELDRRAWLKGKYILLPNVTDGGLGTLMRAGMQAKYKGMPCVGGYLDGQVTEKVGEGNERIFAGNDRAWGNKRLALFQTSDSRSDTFADLGKHSSWVKWATPTAEALRQACLAQESRICHQEPAMPGIRLTRLSVSNSKFMGPIELELNPQYNALIGGRGTGKSTCLEYIRWALCDQPVKAAVDDLADHATRRERLIASTLAPFNAHVEVHFLLNGIQHAVRRHAGGTNGLLMKVGGADFKAVTEEDVRALLPIDAYSQKQLSSVSVRVDEVSRFVTAPIRTKLDQITAAATQVAGRTRENYAILQRQRDLSAAVARDDLAANSLVQQAANVRDSLGGVSEEDRALLAQKEPYDRADEFARGADRKLAQLGAEAETFQRSLGRLQSEIGAVPDADIPGRETILALQAALKTIFDELDVVSAQARRVIDTARVEGSAFRSATDAWAKAKGTYETAYTLAKERSAAHESKLNELADLEQRSRVLRDSVNLQREELTRLGDPASAHKSLRNEWGGLQEERSRCLEEQCARLTELSGGLIRASLRRGAGLANMGERLKATITGSSVRGAKVDACIESIVAGGDPVAVWESALRELEPGEVSNAAPILTGLGFSSTDVQRMRVRIAPDSWLALALALIEDHPDFEYQTKEGEYIAFADASAGQQATALLRVLLNQTGPPLLIDQPEEDLDSQVVLEIVEQIWAAKSRRQLIYASHNPNLVVNGDAELVVCCDYRAAGDHSGGRVKLEGAIDMPDVRAEITVVMEGGERAFRLRKEKYGF